jgi:hypothetical protein
MTKRFAKREQDPSFFVILRAPKDLPKFIGAFDIVKSRGPSRTGVVCAARDDTCGARDERNCSQCPE